MFADEVGVGGNVGGEGVVENVAIQRRVGGTASGFGDSMEMFLGVGKGGGWSSMVDELFYLALASF